MRWKGAWQLLGSKARTWERGRLKLCQRWRGSASTLTWRGVRPSAKELDFGVGREHEGVCLENGGMYGDHVEVDEGMYGEHVGSGEGTGCDACRGGVPDGIDVLLGVATCRALV